MVAILALGFLLAAADPAHERLGRLDWGEDPAGAPWTPAAIRKSEGHSPALAKEAAAIVAHAEATLHEKIAPVKELHLQHVVANDPAHIASVNATRPLADVFSWAFCARVAEGKAATSCAHSARAAIVAWVETYKPTGRPVDEVQLAPLLLAIDVMQPLLHHAEVGLVHSWLRSMAGAGDAFFAAMKPENETTFNNWQSIRLFLRSAVAAITDDKAMLEATRKLYVHHFPRNLPHADGASMDFHARDALHYHVYDVEPLLLTTLLVPELISVRELLQIGKAVDFVRPYFEGHKHHVDYVHSTVAFDRERKEKGDPKFANKPWEPAEARVMLRYARLAIPRVRAWTAAVLDDNYPPHVRVLASLRGER